MRLIVGLGNPGEKYALSRHNVGHMFIEQASPIEGYWMEKTEGYMNGSGTEVLRLVSKYKIKLTDLIIVHDDWDFEVGQYKLQYNRGANHHKGVEDIINKLGTKSFWRLRIGVGPRSGDNSTDFVLGNLKRFQVSQLVEMFKEIIEVLQSKSMTGQDAP